MTTPQPPNSSNVIQFPGAPASSGTAPSAPATEVFDPHEWARQQVWKIRYHPKYNLDQKRRILHNFITNHENRKTARGAFLRTRDHRAYLFDGRGCKLYRIDTEDPEFCGYMLQAYGLNSSEQITRHLITSLRNGAIAMGALREVRRFCYWDRITKTLYISRYDGTCYEIDGDEVKIRSNGYGPAIFIDDDQGVKIDEPTVGNHHQLHKQLIDDLQYSASTAGGMAPETQKTCLGIWLFALAFPDLMPTKPILLVEGSKGAGKSLFLQRIAMTLHGKMMPLSIPKKEDPDFGIKILRSPIAIIDDVNEPVDWLRDTLCTYATGGGWTRRKLFSDDAEVQIKPESFLGITTNNAITFRQGQVADRCLIIRLERREQQDGYTPGDQLFEHARQWRPEVFGEWLYWLNEIVAELRKPQKRLNTPYRMADFAHLSHVIGRVLNQPAGPPGHWSPEHIEEMLAGMQNERDALVIEGDMLIDIIDKWLDAASNQGREVRIADLYKELALISRSMNVAAFYRSPKALAARLKDAIGPLAHHFQITTRPGQGGTLWYTFRRSE